MILFFAEGECDSDAFIKHCYAHFADIMNACGNDYPRDVEIVREYGEKPRFDRGGAHFSLSHSHGVLMLGISHSEIGVDIEKIRPVNIEKFDFLDVKDEDEFFRKWTERESWLKFTGAGLKDFRKPISKDAHFEHFDAFEGYDACVCAEPQNVRAYLIDLSQVEGREGKDKRDKQDGKGQSDKK